VLKGQVDTSARVIWAMEKVGWVYDVRWPVTERINAKLVANVEKTVPVAA
jgi:stearoyl-CoA desaturase (delta-9 desaturase)